MLGDEVALTLADGSGNASGGSGGRAVFPRGKSGEGEGSPEL
jgi:hypothetical protein